MVLRPTILHFDLDAFYAAVEVLLDPSLKGKPVIVGADPRGRGVVATASYEARAFGVHSALPIGTAYRLCPQGVYLRPRHDIYHDYSRRVFSVVARFSDQVQQVSVDEGFVALGGYADPVAVARRIKEAICSETGLAASVGLSTSKLVSKIASDQSKPDGFLVVAPGEEAKFLAPLPVRNLWGVGPKTAARLESLGITTIAELANFDPGVLASTFGSNLATALQKRSKGQDNSPIETNRATKSISDEHTFQKDEGNPRALWESLQAQCQTCGERLHGRGMLARTVTVKLRFGDFKTITRSVTLASLTDDVELFSQTAAAIMRESWTPERRPLRLIGMRLSGLAPVAEFRQLPMFG